MKNDKTREETVMEIELELMSVALFLSKKDGMEEMIQKLARTLENVRRLALNDSSPSSEDETGANHETTVQSGN